MEADFYNVMELAVLSPRYHGLGAGDIEEAYRRYEVDDTPYPSWYEMYGYAGWDALRYTPIVTPDYQRFLLSTKNWVMELWLPDTPGVTSRGTNMGYWNSLQDTGQFWGSDYLLPEYKGIR
jgi:hypothetical protein